MAEIERGSLVVNAFSFKCFKSSFTQYLMHQSL